MVKISVGLFQRFMWR